MLAQVCGTFGLAVALRAGAQFLWTPDFRTITNPLIAGRVQIGPIFIGQPQLLAGAICLLSFVALWLFVTRTETGLGLQATAQDRQAAAVMGIPTERMSALGWAIGLGCVGVAGTMLSTFYYIFPDVGVNFALLAFVAVALGGFGSILGSLVAGVLIGLVESLGGLLIDPSYKTLIVFGLYLACCDRKAEGPVRQVLDLWRRDRSRQCWKLHARKRCGRGRRYGCQLSVCSRVPCCSPFPSSSRRRSRHHMMILIFLYALMAQSWNVMAGLSGQISLGHAIFFGIGAYSATVLFAKFGVTPWVGTGGGHGAVGAGRNRHRRADAAPARAITLPSPRC